MRIGIIGAGIPPAKGGVQTYTWEMARHLARRHDVHLLGSSRADVSAPRRERRENVEIYRYRMPRVRLISPLFYLSEIIWILERVNRKSSFDILHAQYAFPQGVASYYMKRRHGIPYLITSHGVDLIISGKKPWLRPLIRLGFSESSGNIGVSSELTRYSIQHGAKEERTVTLANPVDTQRFKSRGGAEVRKRFGITGDDKVVLALRRLVPKTGIQYLVEIAPQIIAAVARTRFLIVGDGELREELETRVRISGISDHFIFVGSISHPEVPEFIGAADIAVFPSLAEATSIACSEVMSCGIPVVASNVGGLGELVQTGYNGILVSFDRTASTYSDYGLSDRAKLDLKDAIVKLLSNDESRAELGRHAREFVVGNCSWDNYLRRLEAMYEDSLCSSDSISREDNSLG